MLAIERFEGILEKMDECCRQDNTGSEVFSNKEYDMWDGNTGGVGGDVGKRYSCPASGLGLPSSEGKPKVGVRRTKERYEEDHSRRAGSLQRLGLS